MPVEIIRRLWAGDWVTHRGEHLTVEDARLFDLPAETPEIYLGVSAWRSELGPELARTASDDGSNAGSALDPVCAPASSTT